MIRKNTISLLVAVVILVLSFTSPGTFSKLRLPDIRYLDKLVHAAMYFMLMSALIYENRLVLKGFMAYVMLSLIPLVFGALIEIFQTLFTNARRGDFVDFLFNLAGVLLSVMIWLIIKRAVRQTSR